VLSVLCAAQTRAVRFCTDSK
jgi:hypothetical protein